ncbi:putative disease resistance protein RGA3 [Salvia hispanica]|uniref:putative disease resistance protein RGA3 n=1 Tax=Salvia hispanica TaxID=49212 RepID=UPI002009A1C5|nr:putative disease resistance protein RGA3 [Salvia hispanica]
MEGEAVAAVLQVLVQNLIDHSKKEFSLVRGLKKEAKKLSESLDMIQKFLNDAEKRIIPGEAVKSWLKKLENVAFDADNVLDEFNYHLLCKQIKPIMPNEPIKPMKQKVLSCFSPCVKYSRSRNMALRIQEINENLKVINKEAADLGLREMLATNVPTLPDVSRETDCFTLDPIFIGRDEEVSKVVGILTTSITTDERVSIHTIVGMGGLGKTTLTRKVFHLLKEKNLFGSYLWVHVSQIFDPMALLKKILKEVAPHKIEAEMSKQDTMKKLEESLKEKTYLLILDDVWNQDRPAWNDFIQSVLGVSSIKGNVIVVTTRIKEVASTVSPNCPHELKELSEEDCLSIIKEKSFGKKDFPLEFEAIGRKIARRCNGLPLAANVVGGVLRNKSREKWISIEEKWLAHNEGAHITNILRLSYDELSVPSLKKCFAYCSVFPKGHGFGKQELIEYWMAEGFLEADGNNDFEFVGENFINILLDNSLLQITRRYYGGVKCVMHDLVHDLAYSILGGSQDASDIVPVRYMSLEDKSKGVLEKNAKYLRTLLVMDNLCGNMFSEFKSLHVLTFGSSRVIELPSSIMKLIHLRVLNINETRIACLPDWIGKLVHLQTLRAEVDFIQGHLQFPSTLRYLINLRHIYVIDLPAEIGLLTSLRTLEHFKVGDKSGYKIEELGNLNNLNGKLEISRLENVGNKEEAEKANLHKKSKLLELHLKWNHQYGYRSASGSESEKERERESRNDENVLEGLKPHSNLKKLRIEGFKGKRFPSWSPDDMAVENVPRGSWVQLHNVTEISLIKCTECEEIPMLGQLPNLKSLWLEGFTNLKSINSSSHKSHCIVFPALEELILYNMPRLTEWVHTESVKIFPQLQRLKIEICDQLTNFPALSSPPLKNLTIRHIGSYRALENIFKTKLTLLTHLCVRSIGDLECLPNWLFDSNPNLLELEIVNCPKLRRLPNGLSTINSLEKLTIKWCPNLEHMGVQQSQGSLTCLKRLEIEDCNALVYLPCELLVSSLERLSLKNLSSLHNVPEIIDCRPKLARETSLRLLGVHTFSVDNCSGSCSLVLDFGVLGSMETIDGILQGCNFPPVRFIYLNGEGWESLPKSIQSLTALKKLYLQNFGMEELPDWLGNLSSLEWLDISNWSKLRSLPIDVIHSNAKLSWLSISHCPQVCFDISQWPYISHVAIIDIDGKRVVKEEDDEVRREKLWRNFLKRKQSQNSCAEVEEIEDETEEAEVEEAEDEMEEEAEAKDGDAEVEEEAEAKDEESKRGKDLCLSLRCFQRARR